MQADNRSPGRLRHVLLIGVLLGLATAGFAAAGVGFGIFDFLMDSGGGTLTGEVKSTFQLPLPGGGFGPVQMSVGIQEEITVTAAGDGRNASVSVSLKGMTLSSVYVARVLYDVDTNGDGEVGGMNEVGQLMDVATFDNGKVVFRTTGFVPTEVPVESTLNPPPPQPSGTQPVARLNGLIPLAATRAELEILDRNLHPTKSSLDLSGVRGGALTNGPSDAPVSGH